MLLEIKVTHFAIIENLHLAFKEGLNILSGETGSGKSVLLKSLSLLMGGKSTPDIIRTGCEQAVVEGSFDVSRRMDIQNKLENFGIEIDEHIMIVRRLIGSDKSRVYINGQLSSLNILREIVSPMVEVAGPSAPLIELTGQHENKNLLSPSYHLDILDRYCSVWDLRNQYHEKWLTFKNKEKELSELEKNGRNQAQRLDYLEFQRNEISTLELNPGEDEALESEIKKLKGVHKIVQFVNMAESVLDQENDSTLSRLNMILKKGHELTTLDPDLSNKFHLLESAKSNIEEVLYSLRTHVDRMDTASENLEKLEAKLNDLRKLQKKYGPSVNDILKSLVEIENEIHTLKNYEQKKLDLEKELNELKKELTKNSNELHKKRNSGSLSLQELVNQELLDLNMKGVKFHIQIEKLDTPNSFGISSCEFMTQTSVKDLPKPLSKFASGGELSRILLSLKKVIGHSDHPRTYLFDEVDAGVSGETAEKVGKKLRSIAEGQQVICVTHLPQVAVFGNHHFLIQKSSQKDHIQMRVEELTDKERVREIARLISGEKITPSSLTHAQELLKEISL